MHQTILRIILLSTTVFLHNARSKAQCFISSSTGYTMHAEITLKEVVKPASCPYGYNYNLKIGYKIWFSGENIPGSMYTLQGRVGCGSQSLFFDLPNNGGSGELTTSANPWRGMTDCGTATLSSLGCRNVTLEVQGPGVDYQNLPCTAFILPITLVDFGARATPDGADVYWTTSMERDNDHFTVERSLDGWLFDAVTQLPSAGQGEVVRNYGIKDPWAHDGTSYYRLRQTDVDGTSTYSDVVAVYPPYLRTLLVHPNPVENDVLRLSGPRTKGTASIVDATGRIVFTGMVDRIIDVERLAAGTYALHLLDSEGRTASSAKFIKR